MLRLVVVALVVALVPAGARAREWRLAIDSLATAPTPADCECGDIALVGQTPWVAYTRSPGRAGPIVVRPADAAGPSDANFAGDRPSLVALGDGTLVLVSRDGASKDGARIVVRRRDTGGNWSELQPITDPGEYDLGCGRVVVTTRGELLVPVVRAQASDAGPRSEIIAYRSSDGRRWKRGWTHRLDGARDPALVERGGGRWLLVARAWDEIHALESTDDGDHWKPVTTGLGAGIVGHAATAMGSDSAALAWIDRVSDCADPCLQPIRVAAAGATWTQAQPLWLRPGEKPLAVSLRTPAANRGAWMVTSRTRSARVLRCELADVALEAAVRPLPEIGAARERYVVDPASTQLAVDALRTFFLSRPKRAPQLFVEAYTLRALVAAGTASGTGADAAVASARAYADSLVATQNECGYWPLGYGEGWAADMAAALGLFMVLEPHVDAARLARYQATTEKFLQALERDGLFLKSGAVALGWPEGGVCGGEQRMWRSDVGHSHQPYLVSTALAGIVLPAWLHHRTGDAAHAARARRTLDFTLSEIQTDGSVSYLETKEGPYWSAAYVQQGWVAADSLLGDPALRVRLREALRPHVDYLVRTQRPDGLWGDPTNEFARSPSIATFLLWYDSKCGPRDDVRAAILKANRRLSDRAGWAGLGMVKSGIVADILRAFTASALQSQLGARPTL
jgi:hypothetical protein